MKPLLVSTAFCQFQIWFSACSDYICQNYVFLREVWWRKDVKGHQVHIWIPSWILLLHVAFSFFGIDRSTRVGKVSKRQEKVVVAETTATWGENFRKRSKPTRRTENFSNIKSPFIDGSSHVSSEVLLVPKSRTIGKSDHLTLPKDCTFSGGTKNPRERPLLKLPSSEDSREGLWSGQGYILVFFVFVLSLSFLFLQLQSL